MLESPSQGMFAGSISRHNSTLKLEIHPGFAGIELSSWMECGNTPNVCYLLRPVSIHTCYCDESVNKDRGQDINIDDFHTELPHNNTLISSSKTKFSKCLHPLQPKERRRSCSVCDSSFGMRRMPRSNSAIGTSIAACNSGAHLRVYMQDVRGNIRESLYEDGWSSGTEKNVIASAKFGSPIAATTKELDNVSPKSQCTEFIQ